MNTARGELIDEAALADAIECGPRRRRRPRRVRERAADRLAARRSCRRSSRRRTSPRRPSKRRNRSASRPPPRVRDFLQTASSATPSTSRRSRRGDARALRPFMLLAERLGALVAQLAERRAPTRSASGYYGPLVSATRRADRQRGASPASSGRCSRRRVTVVNARASPPSAASRSSSRAARGRELHQPHLGEAAHERRRALGRGHGLRAGQPAADADRRRRGRGAARRHAAVSTTTISPASSATSARFSAATASTSPASRSAATPSGAVGVVNLDRPATDRGLRESLRDIRHVEGVREARLASVS